MAERRATAALVAVMVTTAVFKEAISDLRGMTIDESGLEYDRPQGSATLSAWFGQLAADRANADTMLIPATVQDVRSHVREAIDLEPRGQPGSSLPPDVQAAAAWVARNRGNVPEMREQRCAQLEAIEASLAPWSAQLWRSAAPHVRKMLAYAPKLAFIHALVVALKWPHNELVLDMAMGAQPLGRVPDTGVWRHAPPAVPCDSFEQLMQEDPDWNTRLYNSIKAEGTKPENSDTALAAWARTMEEVDAGWATPVAGGWTELNSRYPDGVRLMRRFGIFQCGKCRCCDSGTASGHNPCTSHEEKLVNVRADFPLEAAALFAHHLGIDSSWTMNVATNDVVAAFRRVACADPRLTIVAQWDPRPVAVGGQRVALFYVQGFNFGLKSAVMAYNAVSELQTRAAVRLLPVVACHYFDDVCCAEPDYACHSAQLAIQLIFRLTGVHLDAVLGRNGEWLPAKRQTPAMLRKFLGVETDFTRFAATGIVRVFVPQARIDKVRQTITEAIARAELTSGDAASLCGKLQFCLSWGVGRFGRAALGALYRQAHRPGHPRINLALEMSLNFFDMALRSLRVRNICVAAVSRVPPILIWSDATGTNEGESAPQIAFVARFPGGTPAPLDPPGLTPIHPRWVHAAMVVPLDVMSELEVRKQQIGQLELLAAIVAYFSMAPFLVERDVLHFIDNTAAVAGIAKGFSAKPDSARIIHAYHALNVQIGAQVYFEWVKSEANIADLPSRGQYDLLNEFGSREVPIIIPPISDWLSPEEAMRNAAEPPKRGGSRH
jgi:hypothetical protein